MVRNVFWRVVLFYLVSIVILGLNVPYNYPGLSNESTATSPFTIVFTQAGSVAASSFINAVLMTSCISAANHALFAGSRLLYTLAVDGYAPRFIGKLNRHQVPWVAVLGTSVISCLCFGASYIGAGQLWSWLQNIVGVCNQLSWLFICLASLRFRSAMRHQNLEHLLPFMNWTYPVGPIIAAGLNIVLILVQGWSSFSPKLNTVDFVSFYVEIAIMIVLFVFWKVLKRSRFVRRAEMDLVRDLYEVNSSDDEAARRECTGWRGKWLEKAEQKSDGRVLRKIKRVGMWFFL